MCQIYLQIRRRSDSQRPDQPWAADYRNGLRQTIEQAFTEPPSGQITMRLPKKIHIVTEADFLIKIVLFLLAYALETNL